MLLNGANADDVLIGQLKGQVESKFAGYKAQVSAFQTGWDLQYNEKKDLSTKEAITSLVSHINNEKGEEVSMAVNEKVHAIAIALLNLDIQRAQKVADETFNLSQMKADLEDEKAKIGNDFAVNAMWIDLAANKAQVAGKVQ